ncbi:MAG: hypothetical protein ABI205_01040 [Gemmatimonadaceae bacterium]
MGVRLATVATKQEEADDGAELCIGAMIRGRVMRASCAQRPRLVELARRQAVLISTPAATDWRGAEDMRALLPRRLHV